MPGSSPTIARREPMIRLNNEDLPTFGRPTMAMVGMAAAWITESDNAVVTKIALIRASGLGETPALLRRRARPSLGGQWHIIETPWPRPRSPQLLESAIFLFINFSRPAGCSHALILHTNSAAGSFKWRRRSSRHLRKSGI